MRATKRREWRNGWAKIFANKEDPFMIDRKLKRLAWQESWKDQSYNMKEVVAND